MKNLLPIFLVTICCFLACSKDSVFNEPVPQNHAVDDRTSVTICHVNNQGQYNAISINQNALAAHLAHGDYLPDADGDGYSAVAACTGSNNDCDDNNPNIHPGAEEICGNNVDDNCNGNIDEGCSFSNVCFGSNDIIANAPYVYDFNSEVSLCVFNADPTLVQSAGMYGLNFTCFAYEYPGLHYFGSFSSAGFCIATVGQGVTIEDWNNTIAGIRAYILAHPETPDFCGGARLESDAAPEQIIGSRAFLKKHNYTFPKSVKLQKGRK